MREEGGCCACRALTSFGVEVESHPSRAESIPRHIEKTLQERDDRVRLCVRICGDLPGRSQAMRFIAPFCQRVDASSSGYSRSSFQCALADKDFRRKSKAWRERSCTRLVPSFGGFGQNDYRSAKRTLRFACDTDGPTGDPLTSYQSFESVADWILSQW